MHSHAALQILVVRTGHVTVRDAAGRERETVRAVISAGVTHEIRNRGPASGEITYIDPGSLSATTVARMLRDNAADPASVDTWLDADSVGIIASVESARHGQELHPVLREALDLVPQLIDGPLLLGDLAGRLGLSASRLGHLFSSQLGLTYPAWRRWARLQHALRAVLGGASLTAAAHAAGFADSAHLTRACRAMFGITPSQALQATQGAPPQSD